MRTITYYLATNQVVESDAIYPNAFSADDNTTQLVFDYTGTACATWDKWLDLTMSDYTKDVQSLGTGTIVTFNLGAEHTKKGLLQVNPYAKSGTDKHGFPIYKLTIERQLNNSTVDASAQQSMIDYFDDRLTVKTVSATTLAPGESATASVTTEADGTTYVFGIPQGIKGDTPTKEDLGLENVDNTSDVDKPISTLTQTALNLKQSKKYRFGFDEYGMFAKPSDFTPTIPCNFYRDSNNVIQTDMNFASYKTGTKIYVNYTSGNDSTGNGSIGTPYKTIKKACDIAAAGADASYCITVTSSVPFMRDEVMGTVTFTNKTIAIVHANGERIVMACGAQRGLTWTQDGTGTWKASRSLGMVAYDFRIKDSNGVYVPLTNKASVAEVQATANSWFTDNTYVWIHTSDGLAPTDSTVFVAVAVGNPVPKLMGTAVLYLENVDFLGMNSATPGLSVLGDNTGSTVGGTFIASNCTFASQGRIATEPSVGGDAVGFNNVKNTYLFNCIAAYSKGDGFNYHYNNVPVGNRRECLALEYNCTAYNCGLGKTDSINNATTSHEGASVLRIGSVGYNTKGATLADVGGCYTICVDCYMYDSLATIGTYYTEVNANGKQILINCRTDDDAVGLMTGVKTFVYNFEGNIADTGYQIVMD